MSYFSILLLFIAPPLVLLGLIVPRRIWSWFIYRSPKPDFIPYSILFLHVILALLYTTPWDNYLVATNVWWYDPDLVTGITLGWVPIEEYIFFVVQTLTTGLLAIGLLRWFKERDPNTPERFRLRLWSALVVAILWIGSTIVLISGLKPATYFSLILCWALVPIWIQLIFGADILLAQWRVLIVGILPATLYLWMMDAFALNQGTWTIDPAQSTGLKIGILPIEEMLFFFLTNLIIVFGITLMNSKASQARALKLLESMRDRTLPHNFTEQSVDSSDKVTTRNHSMMTSHRGIIIWSCSLIFWILTLIAIPISTWLDGEQISTQLINLSVVAQFMSSMIALLLVWNFRRVISVVALAVCICFAAEAISVHAGFPFGRYAYTDILQPQILDVPLMIPLAWMMMLAPAWAISEALIRRNLDRSGTLSGSRHRLLFAVTAGLAFTAWDLFLDPQMVALNLWEWQSPGAYFGVPITNFVGWFVVSALISWIINPTEVRSIPLIWIYIITWVFETVGLGFIWGQPGPALAGFVGMAVFAIPVFLQENIWLPFTGLWRAFSAARYRTL